jgi:DNA polymerase I-like protein with 3'-5' exonuclease and polymerase domains|tara:strand:+ start:1971 stop:3821 length:1851 start_codon:yes stop_codon:yes gene_type:complete
MILFDVEADGLFKQATKIHCLSYTTDGKSVKTLTDYKDMRELLLKEKVLIGHNITRYDIPLLNKLLGIKIKSKLYDTLAMSWVINTDRPKHGLDSFGEEFGIPKPVVTDWSNQSIDVYTYRCEEDVKINWSLWRNLIQRFMLVYKCKETLDRYLNYLSFKMKCAFTAEYFGWKIDKELAQSCVDTLELQQKKKIDELKTVMPIRTLFRKKSKPKVMQKKDGTVSKQGLEWMMLIADNILPEDYSGEIEIVKGVEEPNPKSSDQVKSWLFSLGWKPCTYKYDKDKDGNDKKIPQVRKNGELTESVKILITSNPHVKVLDGLTVIQHRLGIFKGFIDCEVNGYVEAGIEGLTNTLRFKHRKPLCNLPSIDKPWGTEVRGCLISPREDYVLCGADMTSLEDTTKRHYMKPYDPQYVKDMSQEGFDPHLDLAKHAGAVTQKQIDDHSSGKINLKSLRKNYKVVNYSATYGVGAAKLSRETGMTVPEAKKLLDAYWERNWSVAEFSKDNLKKVKTIAGQMWIQNPVSKFWHTLRYEKDVFSTLNQSTGAYCFDKWLFNYTKKRPNIIGQFHDESINVVKKGDEELHKQTLILAMEQLNKELKLNVELGIDVQFGKRYSEIH